MKKTIWIIAALAVISVLTACTGSGTTNESAAAPVEAFLEALVSQDIDRVSVLTCEEWEEQAILEMDAFMGVEATLGDDVACVEESNDGSVAQVSCTGSILATYNNEQQEFSLDGRVYKVVLNAGEWQVCGYP